MNKCKICNSESDRLFSKTILNKYPADYFICNTCGFMQASEPIWLEEAYSSAITSLDIGLLDRNIWLKKEVSRVIDACFPNAKIFLDYAGGYGVLTRLMRDAGYNFFRQDPYCENVFAKHFDIADAGTDKFDLVTAFEVFEHFADPLPEIKKLFAFADHVLFSTVLIPGDKRAIEDWWYIAPETGQHVAFYSKNALERIAGMFNKRLYTNGNNLHLFTSLDLNTDQIDYALNNLDERTQWRGLKTTKLDFAKNRESLLQKDFEFLRTKTSPDK